jgi:eukaryotic-like serine/threonine-protein kinase
VLDFGLAKAYGGETGAGASADSSQSPTLAHTGTQTGVILGTASYMSPEQARARRVDKRADIFQGETVTDVLAAVVHKEPAWDRVPPEVPASIRRLLRRCLAKSADGWLHDIADARIEIDVTLLQNLLAISPRKMAGGVWVGGFYNSTVFALSRSCVLAYAPAGAGAGRRPSSWVDREGRESPLTSQERAYAAPRLSPDGKSILMRMAEDTTDTWSYEISRGVLTRLSRRLCYPWPSP